MTLLDMARELRQSEEFNAQGPLALSNKVRLDTAPNQLSRSWHIRCCAQPIEMKAKQSTHRGPLVVSPRRITSRKSSRRTTAPPVPAPCGPGAPIVRHVFLQPPFDRLGLPLNCILAFCLICPYGSHFARRPACNGRALRGRGPPE